MKAAPFKSFALTLLFALLLISYGCEGGGASAEGGGIGGSGITSQGSVSEFGSIFVNGTEFDTRNAVVIVEGEEKGVGDAVVLNNLDVGMVVTVYGTRSQDGKPGVANRVTYNKNVEGPVESIDDKGTRKDIVVLGQTVIVNFITEFKPSGFTFNNIAVDDVVEVSGFVDDTGAIRATFIEKTGDFTPGIPFDVEVTGMVQNLNTTNTTFDISGLMVDYTAVVELPSGFADGMLVEVEGTLDDFANPMIATAIVEADELDVEDADEIEVTGFVTDDTFAPGEFTLGNQVVRTDAATIFVDGTAGNIAPGQKLEAEGRLENGILFAWEIEFWEPDQIEVEGIVDSGTASDFILEIQVGVYQRVQTDGDTVYEEIARGDIVPGVKLEVKGVPVDIDRSILTADKVSLELD